jgi:hypothetical protein
MFIWASFFVVFINLSVVVFHRRGAWFSRASLYTLYSTRFMIDIFIFLPLFIDAIMSYFFKILLEYSYSKHSLEIKNLFK